MDAESLWTESEIVLTLRAAGCVFAEDEARLLLAEARSAQHLDAMVAQRVVGRPLEVILGWAEFCGLKIAVQPGVFVPRQRTELLVREGAARARAGSVVVDLCCGTAAVGVALAARVPGIELYAADIDPVAVACARRNVGDRGQVFAGDLYGALPAALIGRIAVLVVNAPYVPTEAIALMPPEARLYEPPVALDGGYDGLDVQRRVAAEAPRWLADSGSLLVETSKRQAPRTAEVFTAAGLAAQVIWSEGLDATIVVGTPDR